MQQEAVDLLLQNHIESEKLSDAMSGMGRAMPTAAVEHFLKEVCKNATGSVRTNAVITLSQFLDRREMYRNIYGNADEETTKRIGEEAAAYFKSTPDPNELTMIESMLTNYVDANKDLMEKAKNELFVVKNLSVGRKAMEIVGTDLDGKDFKLSDYRGKVVFLDFWGDW